MDPVERRRRGIFVPKGNEVSAGTQESTGTDEEETMRELVWI